MTLRETHAAGTPDDGGIRASRRQVLVFWGMSCVLCAAQAPAQETPAGQEDDLGEVVVSGIRHSLGGSARIKRQSLEVVDSISAEDVGRLPDANVAETMTRIPGVQGYRYGGEGASPVGVGSGLTIRGLSGQTASRVDGRAYFTAGNREFNIEGAIPGMIAGIDVYKNPSAEHIEGGIGGLVNIRTRRPFDFEDTMIAAAATVRYNDLATALTPEVFGLFSHRRDAGDGEIGFLIAANVQHSHNRSDSNPANGGVSLRRAVRADSAEFTTIAAANQAYAGRSDVWYLADVANPLALTAGERAELITATTQQAPVFQEDILRTRRGFNAAVQWANGDDLRLHAETRQDYYLYHQKYRFLFANDTRTVQELASSPFALFESLANRNTNGGTDELLSGRALAGGTFLDSTLSSIGGLEDHPYETTIYAAGFGWSATPDFALELDLSHLRAEQDVDNRSVSAVSAPGLTWDVTRDLTRSPHRIGFGDGPALDLPTTWMFNDYGNGNHSLWRDTGVAAALNGTWSLDGRWVKSLKAGVRWAVQKARFRSFSYGGRPLTSDGAPLAADRSNGILFAGMPEVIGMSPDNWLGGDAGYPGGYAVYSPEWLAGDRVRDRFPLAGIPADDALPENLPARRYAREESLAGFVQANFGLLDDRIDGNLGARIVRTDLSARAQVPDVPGPGTSPRTSANTYSDVLPSFNLRAHLSEKLQLRLGYGKGITRPSLDLLNPARAISAVNGTGSRGNPELRPLKADSLDLALEWYFSDVGYLSAAVFNKDIDGFLTAISECETLADVPPYAGATPNGCVGGQYFITRTVNSEPGFARGFEIAGQAFFDFLPGFWRNVGVQGSYSRVTTENPVRFVANGPIFDAQQPFQSDDSYSLAAIYEDARVSSRLVYTYRSDYVLFGVSANPIDGRYLKGYGILDFALNYRLADRFEISINASNLGDQAPDRYVGEPGVHATGFERQHFLNGRNYSLALRYRLGR